MVLAPLTIFVDLAGSVDFQLPKPGKVKKALVICAVAVPLLDFDRLRAILPRNAEGAFLKAQGRDFNPDLALTFAKNLLASEADVGARLIDPGTSNSIELATKLTEIANANRKSVRDAEATPEGKRLHPPIKQQVLHYFDFVCRAINACWGARWRRTKQKPSFVSIVADTEDGLSKFQREWFVNMVRDTWNANGVRIEAFEWKKEEEEPLLLLPDLFAGILHREDTRGDVGPAARMLWDAQKAGRFIFDNNEPPTAGGEPAAAPRP